MSFLNIQNLNKQFGDFTAVEDFNLSIEKGEFISLLGPSGCGKTTTLQMIAGFLEPTRGKVLIDGKDITSLLPEKRGMGVVFQSYALFPHMTVEQNIAFGLQMRHIDATEQHKRIGSVLDLVHLDGLEKRYPRELSGGQRQRVAIARALAIQPEVLLLDEPMSNLDAKLREEMHIEMRNIQRHLGITTILVTHDQIEAMTMSDRIAVMHGGKVVQLDNPYSTYEYPVSHFASTFLGKTNVLKGGITEQRDGVCVVDVAGTKCVVNTTIVQSSKEVCLYIRPEKITILPPNQPGLAGHIKTKLFLGSHWMLEVMTELGVLRVSVVNQGMLRANEGDIVQLAWQADDMRILASE